MTPLIILTSLSLIVFVYIIWYISGAKLPHLVGLYTFIIPVSFIRIPLGSSVSLRLEELLLAASIVLVITHSKKKLTISKRGKAAILALFIFLVAAFISQFILKDSRVQASLYNITKMIGGSAFFFVGIFACRNKDDLTTIAVWASVTIFVVFILLLFFSDINLLAYGGYDSFKHNLNKHNYINPEWGSNALGEYSGFLAMLSTIGYISTKKKKLSIFLLSGIIIGSLIPILVLSRGAIGGMLVFFAGLVWLYKKEARSLATPIFVILIILVVYFMAGFDERKDVMDIDIETGKGFSGRYELWEASYMAFKERPVLGWGMGSENWVLVNFGSKTHSAHNTFLIVLIQMGILGTLVFSGFLLVLALPFKDNELRVVNAMFLAMLAASMFSGSLFFAKIALPGLSVVFAVNTWSESKSNRIANNTDKTLEHK